MPALARKADGFLRESRGPHVCGPYSSAFRFVGGGVLDAPRSDRESAPAIFNYIV